MSLSCTVKIAISVCDDDYEGDDDEENEEEEVNDDDDDDDHREDEVEVARGVGDPGRGWH